MATIEATLNTSHHKYTKWYQPQTAARQYLLLPSTEPSISFQESFGQGSVFFVGTATVIIRYGNFTILTDPNFLHAGDHVHLGWGFTAIRQTNPAMELDTLPPIDFVLLSHYHGDHFDQVVEARLNREIPIISTRHATSELSKKGFKVLYPLDTWDRIVVIKGDTKLTITSLPGQHAPTLLSMLHVLPPVMGSMLEWESISNPSRIFLRLYISGDTLLCNDLAKIKKRFSDIDLALVHLGGTTIMGIVVTMDDKQGVELVKMLDPHKVIPIHYNDYDVFKSPLEDFKRSAAAAGLQDKMVYLAHGDTFRFAINL